MNTSAAIADPLLRQARGLRTPHAGLTTRLGDFATNRHESCGLGECLCEADGGSEHTVTDRIVLRGLRFVTVQSSRNDGCHHITSIMRAQYVFHASYLTHSRCGQLGRRHDISVIGLGAFSEKPESCTGIHGAVSVCRAPLSPHRLGSHGDTRDDRSDAAVVSRRRCHESFLLVGNRHGEADAGRPVAVPHLTA